MLIQGGCGMSSVSGRVASCIHSGPLKIILQVNFRTNLFVCLFTDNDHIFLQLASYGAVCYA